MIGRRNALGPALAVVTLVALYGGCVVLFTPDHDVLCPPFEAGRGPAAVEELATRSGIELAGEVTKGEGVLRGTSLPELGNGRLALVFRNHVLVECELVGEEGLTRLARQLGLSPEALGEGIERGGVSITATPDGRVSWWAYAWESD